MKTNNYPIFFYKTIKIACLGLMLALLPLLSHAQRVLVWEENFNATTLNPAVWAYETGDGCSNGNCGWGNQELEYYTNRTENVRLESGHLVIEARRENMGGKSFTSGRIKTSGRVNFRYGALEARIKVPKVGNGLWPAFWMLGATGGTWPHNGEIDILEMGSASAISANKANKLVNATVHWWTDNPGGYTGHASYGKDTSTAADLSDDFHLYRMEWNPTSITIFLDNAPYYTINTTGGNGLDAFQHPFYIVLNLAVGGNYPGILTTGGITAPLPGQLQVDYIRLYQDVAQNEYLTYGTDDEPEGNYGIFTDNTVVNDKVTFGTAAQLYLWNNITNITAPVPYEGSQVWAFHANAGNWFGLGIANDPKNMSNFAGGSLKLQLKTTSTTPFKIGIATGDGEGWVMFNRQNGEHGLVRDGQWHEVTIPISEFGLSDLTQTTQLFMFSGDAPAAAADFYLDNIYYTGGVTDNPAPKISLTKPASDTVYKTPAAIQINTNATDANGSISKVTFYSNDNYIGTTTSSPFNYTWNTSATGVQVLTAKATDNQNKTTTSKPVRIFVTKPNNTAPAISITAPTGSANYMKPAQVNITTNITDDGGIYKVEFYNGSTLIGTIDKAPYNFTWANVDQGTYTIQAKAYDDGNLSTLSSPVTFTVKDNKILSDLYGIYTDTSAVTNKLTLGVDANLYVWNNLTTIAGAMPKTGSNVIAYTATAGNWFGLGVSHDIRNLSHFSNGYLKFWFKTSYQGSFRFSVISQSGQYDLSFAAAEQKLGLVRDGQWHQVIIPVNTLTGLDLTTISQAFTFSGDAPANDASFYIDEVYYTTQLNESTPTSTNLALNKPVTVTSVEAVGTPGTSAVDGNLTTRWSSAFSDPQSITVDLGATYNINEVKVTWEAAAGKNYEVQISADQSNWTTLKSVTNNTTLVNDHTGLSGAGRYLRIYGTSRVTAYGYSIYELEAYGTATGARLANSIATHPIDTVATWAVTITPNPVTGDQLQLYSNVALKQLSIVDISGKTRSTQLLDIAGKAPGIYQVNISSLPPGLYLLQVYNSLKQQRGLKFIKQ
ncbi:Ig-like domain-containing protein [Chitinophaga sp. 30R24]|uniref:Ig-like domain-containing protein n=1 Tax=Chitinophaga sp. 30R24 TaxID=3248838 RepID=UPI003B915789